MTDMDASTPQLKAAKALLDGYSSRDLDAVESHLSKDFRYQTFPKVDRYPDQTKEEHVQFWRSKFSAFTKTKFAVQEVIEAPGKVVIHLVSTWSRADGNTLDHPSVLIFTFVEEDQQLKAVKFKHFTDPDKRANYHAAADKALAERAGVTA